LVANDSKFKRRLNMKQQRGGTFLGFVIGVVFGLAAALAVAVYVTKVPVPFMNKAQSRSAEQDAAETKKNKDWDPNAPLYGKNPAKIVDSAAALSPPPSGAASSPAAKPAAVAKPNDKTEAKADSKGDGKVDAKSDAKADSKADVKAAPKAESKADTKATPAPAVSADPLAELAKAKGAATEPFYYFVQVGAFRNSEDAEAQRAKLSLSGVSTKVSEREQAGQVVFRVRVGPFDKKGDADASKEKLDALGLETALVRVTR
jgi:cell division protein FtsN